MNLQMVCPQLFRIFLAESRKLEFSERPNYDMLLSLFVEDRATMAETEGAPIKDHDVQWVDKASLVTPVPIQERTVIGQPDDNVLARAFTRALSRASSKGTALSRTQASSVSFDSSDDGTRRSLLSARTPGRPVSGGAALLRCGVSERPVANLQNDNSDDDDRGTESDNDQRTSLPARVVTTCFAGEAPAHRSRITRLTRRVGRARSSRREPCAEGPPVASKRAAIGMPLLCGSRRVRVSEPN